MPQYQIWIEADDYSKVAFVREFAKLEYTQRLNGLGYAALDMHPDDAKVAELQLGRRLKIIRDGAIVFGGRLLREGWSKPESSPAGETWQVYALDHADYARARICIPPAGSEYETYTDHADDVAKRYVLNNAGSGAASDRVFSDLSVEADAHAAALLTENARYDNLLDVLQKLAAKGGFDFRFVPLATGCEFRTAYPHWGLDRRKGNGVNDEFVLSLDRKTFSELKYVRDATAMVNAVYVGGQGEGTNRAVVLRTDTTSIATWKRREAFADARHLTLTSSLQAYGDAELVERAVEESMDGKPALDSWRSANAPTWDLGDLITLYVRAWGRELTADAKIVAVNVSITPDGLEQVRPELQIV